MNSQQLPTRSRATGWLSDLRFAIRGLRRRPGHTVVSALTMALGIGAVTLLFTVASGVLFDPLPWPQAERLVKLEESREGGNDRITGILTNGTYLTWRDNASTLEELGGWQADRRTLVGTGQTRRLQTAKVTPSLFRLLGARPQLGSLFVEHEDRDAKIILSMSLKRQLLGESQDVLGQVIVLDDEPFEVVGVMPSTFSFPDRDTLAWTPLSIGPVIGDDPETRTMTMFRAIGRLRPGASPAAAAAEGTARGRQAPDPGMVAMAVFGSNGPVEVRAERLLDSVVADVKPAILVFMAAVGLLLITATANVASLLLARATDRHREIAVRSALGAGSGRLARQFLIEGSLLALLGGAGGLALAAVLFRSLPRLLPADFPRVDELTMDLRVLVVAAAVSMASGIVFGLVPLLHCRRLPITGALAGAVAATAKGSTTRARAAIIVAQVAIACTLLIAGSLLGRSFVSLLDFDRGYQTENLLTARLIMPDGAFTGAQRANLLDRLNERLSAHRGVVHAGIVNFLPLTAGDAMAGFTLPTADDPEARASASIRVVSPGYFASLGLRAVEGRVIDESDRAGSLPAVVVNETFARRYLPEGALDRSLPQGQVVGVVNDVRHRSATDPIQAELYLSYRQMEQGYGSSVAYLVARTGSDPIALVPDLRSIVREDDASLALESVETMETRLLSSLAQPRLVAVLLLGFATFALLVAAAGLFGVLSYSVVLRRREIGLRTALGASAGNILALFLRQGLGMTAGGVLLGVAMSLALTRLLGSLLFGVSSSDLLSYVAAPALLLLVAAQACLLPARRATRIQPQTTLRSG